MTVGFDLGEGKATLGLNGNYTSTKVIRASPVISADRERFLELEGFVPQWKGNASFDYQGGRFGFLARANYYGEWTDYGANLAADQTGGAELLVDLEASYKINEMFKIAIGAENVFDNYRSTPIPDQQWDPLHALRADRVQWRVLVSSRNGQLLG